MNYSKSDWYGFERINFDFEGRQATLVLPKEPCSDKKWLYKIEYFEAFPSFELDMLKMGYYVAGLSNKSRLCPMEDTDLRPRFCDFLKKEFGLHEKCLPVAMSCGGMQAVYFAAKYPEYIAALYLDAPVLNLLSWPLGLGDCESPSVEEFLNEKNISISDMLNYREHPIDQKEKLLNANIPIFLVCGDSDVTVPYKENGKILSEYFKENNGNLTEIVKSGCGHHPHGLEDNTPLLEFAQKYY